MGDAILKRVGAMLSNLGFEPFRNSNIEVLGAEHTYGPHARVQHTREVVLRLVAHHNEPRALQFFLMEIAPVSSLNSRKFIDLKSLRHVWPLGLLVLAVVVQDLRVIWSIFHAWSTKNMSIQK